jgi:hypothetical protein
MAAGGTDDAAAGITEPALPPGGYAETVVGAVARLRAELTP